MKTIICLALYLLAVSALSRIEDLPSALELLDLQDLLDDCKGFELSASFTYLGGPADDDRNANGPELTVTIAGTYNLIKWEDGKNSVKTTAFNDTKHFAVDRIVNFTGSGSFNARGGGDSDEKGIFNGASYTDFIFKTESGLAAGIREDEIIGEFKNQQYSGSGNIDVNVWQNVNSSKNHVEYTFGKDQRYSGSNKAEAHVITSDSEEYRSSLSAVFHGINSKTMQMSGGYVWDVYNSNGDNVYSKDGTISRVGPFDIALGSFGNMMTFGLPSDDMISE